jgi:RimJ/RimL family protein N-acetyltransferase
MEPTSHLEQPMDATRVLPDGRVVRVRVAVPEDAAGVVGVRRATAEELLYTVAEPDEIDLDETREREAIVRSSEEPGWRFLVAECGGVVVGYLEFSNGIKRRTRHSGIFAIYLLDGWRGLGIGRILIEQLLDWARANPLIEKITLAVFASNERARALYERCGFAVEGYCPRDLKRADGTYDDSVLMYVLV